ncbi:efflux RND transporter periplasmic adaptor subunit [Bradyrhizobium sp.]|uniref:HlyD family secretion protein n=1 Tax=Bradyrhizobium sp. TaxID=376 RepID=UPI00238A7895|nr:efflux RND transporter periplasmic adaptor subunit [Bradyrhizobium sp.]MDE2378305.1 efflux RND transporter periplasmic adaptor subunit [Bradyrhizobium sp.]
MIARRSGKASLALLCLSVVAVLATAPLANTHAQGSAPPDPAADKRWLAVAPGRVEPVSGLIKIAGPVAGVVDAVLVKANETVFAGQPLIRLRDQEARAQLASAAAQVAMRKRVRNKESAASGASARRRAEDAAADAEAAVWEVQSLVDKAVADRRTGRSSDADVEAARAGLKRAKNYLVQQTDELRRIAADAPLPTVAEGQLNVARSEWSVSRAALDKLTIRAPIDGSALQVNARAGELVSPAASTPLVLLGDVSALRVRAEVDERDIEKIKSGQPVLVRSSALRGREIAGTVSFVAPLVEPGRYTALGQRNMTDVDVVEVLVDLSEADPLVVGMKVDVYFRRDAASR